jgi:hypothetical protein
MNSATIKLYLPFGDPRRLRTAEISNWSGKSIAASRTDLDELFARVELGQAGVYLLLGTDPESGRPAVYVGEAEAVLRGGLGGSVAGTRPARAHRRRDRTHPRPRDVRATLHTPLHTPRAKRAGPTAAPWKRV